MVAWNSGLTKFTDSRVLAISKKLSNRLRSEEHCKNISIAKRGKLNLKRRTPLIEIVCLNCMNIFKVKYKERHRKYCNHSCQMSFKNKTDWATKKDAMRKMISNNHWNTKMENNPNWMGGISFLPYTPFRHLKIDIIRRDKKESCLICNNYSSKGYVNIHHIDYDKTNNSLDNLCLLCPKCHCKTNFNREFWSNYIKKEVMPQ